MDKHLHIVTHDVPWPADFGGVTDLFYKIKALHSLGIKIHLHCFKHKRQEQTILNNYCDTVKYYPRKTGISSFSLRVPYIVSSRNHSELLKNLQADSYPVLLEGIHCTWLLQQGLLSNRKVIVRLHNVEYIYYGELARQEKNLIKRAYFIHESRLLKSFEANIASKALCISVSQSDAAVYSSELGAQGVRFLPVFLPWQEVSSAMGKGNYCLYHGNLSINENEQAATWLLSNVFSQLNIPFIIAGKNPSGFLRRMVAASEHATLIADPDDNTMQELIQKAQINILPSFNKTGVKIKLLNALYNGRFCIANEAAIKGSGVESLCHYANDAAGMIALINTYYNERFTEEKKLQRETVLQAVYDASKNAAKLIAWIY